MTEHSIDPGHVTRTVQLPAPPEVVWRAVSDEDERAAWLDDPDAAERDVRVDVAEPGHRLVWTWWHPGDEGSASRVEVVMVPVDGGTHLTVVESRPAAPARGPQARGDTPPAAAERAWGSRLLGLELLLVTAGVGAR